jgi:hypothetical protein
MRRRLMVPGCFMATSLADGSNNFSHRKICGRVGNAPA